MVGENLGTSLVVQWLGLSLPLQGAQVQSLVREPRSHKLSGTAEKKKKKGRESLKTLDEKESES